MKKQRTTISYRLRFEVLKRDGFACRYCGARAPNVVLHLDHVVAVARGGDDEMANLCACCSACNLGKGVEPVDGGTVCESLRRYFRESGADRPREPDPLDLHPDNPHLRINLVRPVVDALRRRLGKPYCEYAILNDLARYVDEGVRIDDLMTEANACADYEEFSLAAGELFHDCETAEGGR